MDTINLDTEDSDLVEIVDDETGETYFYYDIDGILEEGPWVEEDF